MTKILSEDIDVHINEAGSIEITHVQVHDDGIDMGGRLVFDPRAVSWVAVELQRAARGWGYEGALHNSGEDTLHVYIGGNDMVPFVHLQNRRSCLASGARTYALGMSVAVAQALADKLAAL